MVRWMIGAWNGEVVVRARGVGGLDGTGLGRYRRSELLREIALVWGSDRRATGVTGLDWIWVRALSSQEKAAIVPSLAHLRLHRLVIEAFFIKKVLKKNRKFLIYLFSFIFWLLS